MPLPDLFFSFLSAAVASLVFCLLKVAFDKSTAATGMVATGTTGSGFRLHRRTGTSSSAYSSTAGTTTAGTIVTPTTNMISHKLASTPSSTTLPSTTATTTATARTTPSKGPQSNPPSRKWLKVSIEETFDSLRRRRQHGDDSDHGGSGCNANSESPLDLGQLGTTSPTPPTTTTTAATVEWARRRLGGRKLSVVLEEERPLPPPPLSEA